MANIRKNTKNRLKCDVSIAHGRNCFYANRGLGECSEEVELDRIVPESRGGRYTLENCLIACAKHNGARGDQSIEVYLASAVRTPDGTAH